MTLRAACLAAALVLLSAHAQASEPDPRVKASLDAKETPYEVDEDGDFKIVVRLDDDRTQLVWVRSAVSDIDFASVREIWSPGYEAATDTFPSAIANDLLARSNDLILGGWVKQDRVAMLVVKVPADASADELDEAIDLAALSADEVEKDLTGKDAL
jgi:hypothetical protein